MGVRVARIIRSYPSEYRRWILEQLANTDESLVEYSVRCGIPASTLSTWRGRERQEQPEDTPSDQTSTNLVETKAAPSDVAMGELEREVLRLRAENERQRIAFAHQALELAEALVEVFCLRHGMDPAPVLGNRSSVAPFATREPKR